MLSKFSKLCFMVLCAYILSSCSSAPPGAASFTIISDQNDKTSKHYVAVGAPVESKKCVMNILIYSWFGTFPVEETQLSKLLEDSNADALIDAEFRHSFVLFPILFSRSCLTISGTPVKLKGAP